MGFFLLTASWAFVITVVVIVVDVSDFSYGNEIDRFRSSLSTIFYPYRTKLVCFISNIQQYLTEKAMNFSPRLEAIKILLKIYPAMRWKILSKLIF